MMENKKNKEVAPKKVLKNYTVKTEAVVPATITYTVKAYSPEEAADLNLILRTQPTHIQYKIRLLKIKKITVYEYLSVMIKFIKNIF